MTDTSWLARSSNLQRALELPIIVADERYELYIECAPLFRLMFIALSLTFNRCGRPGSFNRSKARRRAACRCTSSSSGRRRSPASPTRQTARRRPTTRARTRSVRRWRRARGRSLLDGMGCLS